MVFFTFLLLSLVVARVTRLITEDTILDEPRRWLLDKLWEWRRPANVHQQAWEPPYLRKKIHYLLTCPWCSSLYVSAGVIGATYLFTDASIPFPWFWWPALAMAAVLYLEYTDGEKPLLVRLKK